MQRSTIWSPYTVIVFRSVARHSFATLESEIGACVVLAAPGDVFLSVGECCRDDFFGGMFIASSVEYPIIMIDSCYVIKYFEHHIYS